MNTILQVPIKKQVRDKAASMAEKMGFSSLQEVVRVFLNKVAAGEVSIDVTKSVKLSSKAIKRYDKMTKDIESGKTKLQWFDNVDGLMKNLNS